MTTLSNISDVATEETNTAGVRTPILVIEPEDGTSLFFRNSVPRGDAPGIPIYAKLRDSNGDPLPQDTNIVLTFQAPSMDDPISVSVPRKNIRPYRGLSIEQQQNEEYIDRIKHELKGPMLEVEDVEEIRVEILSSKQIDWANSRLQFAESGVKEV